MAEQSKLDKFLFELTGTDEDEFFKMIRLENDPWAAVEEVLEEVKRLNLKDSDNFIAKAEKFQATFGETIQEQLQDREYEHEPEDRYDRRYSSRQFGMDKWGIEKKAYAITDVPSFTTREAWVRTKGHTDLIHMTEFGNFSMDITARYQKSLVRVTSHYRHGIPYLGVGAIQINMNNGHAKCWTSGCKWEDWLTHSDDPNKALDKEWCEYQVLLILEHLGTHTIKNPKNYWTPIKSVKRFRDSEDTKMRLYLKQRRAGRGR